MCRIVGRDLSEQVVDELVAREHSKESVGKAIGHILDCEPTNAGVEAWLLAHFGFIWIGIKGLFGWSYEGDQCLRCFSNNPTILFQGTLFAL